MIIHFYIILRRNVVFELLQAIPYLWLTLRMSGLAANLIVYPVITYMCPFYFFSASFDTYTKCSGILFFFLNATECAMLCDVSAKLLFCCDRNLNPTCWPDLTWPKPPWTALSDFVLSCFILVFFCPILSTFPPVGHAFGCLWPLWNIHSEACSAQILQSNGGRWLFIDRPCASVPCLTWPWLS